MKRFLLSLVLLVALPVQAMELGMRMGVNNDLDASLSVNNTFMNAFRDAGFTVTSINVPRHDVQRSEVDFTWRQNSGYPPGYEPMIDFFNSKNQAIGYMLIGGNPNGCPSGAGYPWDSAGLPCFEKYAFDVGYSIRPHDISYIELYNEPNLSSFWGGTRAQFITYVNAIIPKIKEGWDILYSAGNPKPYPKFIGPAVSDNITTTNWGGNFLAECGADNLDGISFHHYMDKASDPARRTPELGYYDGLKTTLAAIQTIENDPGFTCDPITTKPLYITETGVDTYHHSYDKQAELLPKLIQIAYMTGGIHHYGMYNLVDSRDVEEQTDDKHYGLAYTTNTEPGWTQQFYEKPALVAIKDYYTKTIKAGYLIVRDNPTQGIDVDGRICLSEDSNGVPICTYKSDGRIDTDPDYSTSWAVVYHKPSTGHSYITLYRTDGSDDYITLPNLKDRLGLPGNLTTTYNRVMKIKGFSGYTP